MTALPTLSFAPTAQPMPRANQQRQAALHRHMVRRIIEAWNAASAEDLSAGRAWYSRAQAYAHELSIIHKMPLERVAAVIACLSPRAHWHVNLTWAGQMIEAAAKGEACPLVSTTDNRAKAWAFATGQAAAVPNAPEFGAHAPKVRRFFANIMGDELSVTVDVWAARVAEGRTGPAPAGGRYQAIEAAYQSAASIVEASPRDVQAATWVAVRGRAT